MEAGVGWGDLIQLAQGQTNGEWRYKDTNPGNTHLWMSFFSVGNPPFRTKLLYTDKESLPSYGLDYKMNCHIPQQTFLK